MAQQPGMVVPRHLEPFSRTLPLSRSGANLFYFDAGSSASPVMLLVHGLGDEADTWRSVIQPLSRHFRVIAPDLPGFGRSSLPRRPLTPRYLARVILELMAALHLTTVTGVGSSLGAVLLQLAASREPALFRRLLLEDGGLGIAGKLPPALLVMLIPGLGGRRYRGLSGDLAAAYMSLRPYYADLDGMQKTEREFLRQRVIDRVGSDTQRRAYLSALRGYIGWLSLFGRSAHRRSTRFDLPLLRVWGAQDHIVPLSAAKAAGDGEGLTVIDGAGHLPHQEKPREFIRVVLDFAAARGAIAG
jgi:pimeloyl-ACP methyl ester carboxylesterase